MTKTANTHRLTETAIQCLKLYFILKILIGKYVKLFVRKLWVCILMSDFEYFLGKQTNRILSFEIAPIIISCVVTCMASCVMVFKSFPCIARLASWYSHVLSLWEVLPLRIWSLVPRTYLVREEPVSGWISLLSLFMASLLTMLSENIRGVISGQSILEVGSFLDDGFSKQPCFPPKAYSLQILYSGWARVYRI